jgi:hypothetical protein
MSRTPFLFYPLSDTTYIGVILQKLEKIQQSPVLGVDAASPRLLRRRGDQASSAATPSNGGLII